MKKLQQFTKEVFKSNTEEPPWPRMVLCAFATGTPLMIGLIRGELQYCIYAALIGYLIELNDHLGSLRHRLLIATLSFIALIFSFTLGLLLHGNWPIFISALLFIIYWLGLMGGRGAEVERILLFSAIQMLVAYYNTHVDIRHIDRIFEYSIIVYFIVVIGITITQFLFKGVNLTFTKIKEALGQTMTKQRTHHLYAISFVFATLIALSLVHFTQIERGYWCVITTLLIMKPDRKESVRRGLQRFVGTALGVLVGETLVLYLPYTELVIAVIMFCAFTIPYAMKRNYWQVSFFVSIVVLLLMNLPNLGHPDTHLPYVRLEATIYGCLIGLTGVLIDQVLHFIFMKRKTG